MKALNQGLDWRGAWLKAYGRDEMGNPDPNAIRSGQLDQQYLQEIINAQHVLLRDEAVKQEREGREVAERNWLATCAELDALAPLLQCWREWVEARKAIEPAWEAWTVDDSPEEAAYHAAVARADAAEAALAAVRMEGEV